jgi:hypothetical protein
MSFEVLISGITTKVVVDAIYYMTRLIRHRGGARGSAPRLLVEGLRNEPSPEAEALARTLLNEVERKSKSPIEKLSAKEADKVVGQLEKLILKRYLEGATIDRERGQALLEELRGSSKPPRPKTSR